MLEKIKNYMIENWGEMTMTGKSPVSPSFSMKSGRSRKYISVYDNKAPLAWIKFYEDSSYNYLIKEEYQNLVYIYNKTHSFVQKGIPAPLSLGRINDNDFLVVSYVNGSEISETINPLMFIQRRRFFKYLSMIKKWLFEFQAQTKQGEVLITQDNVEYYTLRPFSEFFKKIQPNEEEKKFFTEYQKKIKCIIGTEIPFVSSHGDFFAGNIIFDAKDTIGVVDWLDLNKKTTPFFDIFMLITTFRLPGKNNQKNIMDSLKFTCVEKNWFSMLIRQFVGDYLSLLKMKLNMLKIYYPVFLFNRIFHEDKSCGKLSKQYWREQFNFYIKNQEAFWS